MDERPNRLAKSASRPKLLPASAMNIRGRYMASIWQMRLVRDADLPDRLAEDEAVGIHLPVQLVERVEGQRRAATVEQREARGVRYRWCAPRWATGWRCAERTSSGCTTPGLAFVWIEV